MVRMPSHTRTKANQHVTIHFIEGFYLELIFHFIHISFLHQLIHRYQLVQTLEHRHNFSFTFQVQG